MLRLCLYYIQGERGESETHPNAFKLPAAAAETVTLDEFIRAFPLSGTAPFHFRFKLPDSPSRDKNLYVDLTKPTDKIPLCGGVINAKVLRMDAIRCSTGRRSKLQPGYPTPFFRNAPSTPSSSGVAPPPPPRRAADGGAVSSPLAGAGSSAGGGSGAGRAAHNPGHGHGHDDEPNLLPLHEPPALVMPSRVDADLVGKSDVVIAKVMARREDERRKEQERIAAVRQAELDQQRAEMAKDSLRATLGPKIKDWAESNGTKKDIRVLLSTLQNVLWADSGWNQTPISELIMPNRVRFHFLKASRVVHPDRNNTVGDEQKFIATAVFNALEQAYRVFEAAELRPGGA